MTSLAATGQLQFKPRVGVFYMLAAIAVLGSTDAIVKLTSASVDPIQIGFSRFVVSLIMVLWLVGRSQPGFAALRTKRPVEHAARAFCAAVELTAFYFAISMIPLPTAMSIVAASPIFGTVLGIVFLRERLRLGGWIAVFPPASSSRRASSRCRPKSCRPYRSAVLVLSFVTSNTSALRNTRSACANDSA